MLPRTMSAARLPALPTTPLKSSSWDERPESTPEVSTMAATEDGWSRQERIYRRIHRRQGGSSAWKRFAAIEEWPVPSGEPDPLFLSPSQAPDELPQIYFARFAALREEFFRYRGRRFGIHAYAFDPHTPSPEPGLGRNLRAPIRLK